MNIQLILINILHIFNDGYQAAFLLLLPFIAKDLHINLLQIGNLGSMLYIIETILALPAGQLGSRFDGIRILTILTLIFSIGFFSLIGVFSFVSLLFPFVLIGIAYGLFHPIGFALVAQFSEKKTRGRMIGDFTAVGDLGRIVLPAIITYLTVYIGWKSSAIAYGSSAFILFLVTFLFYHHKKKENKSEQKTKDPTKIIDLLKNKRFLIAITTSGLDSIASSSLFLFLPFLLIKKGFDPTILGSFAAAYFIGNFLGKSVLGRIADKFGNSLTFIIAEFFMAVFIIFLTISNSILFIIIVSVILGTLTKGTIPARSSMTIETIEHHGRFEKAISVNAFFVSLLGSIAPAMYGRVAYYWGINNTFHVSALFALLAIIPAVLFAVTKNKTRFGTM